MALPPANRIRVLVTGQRGRLNAAALAAIATATAQVQAYAVDANQARLAAAADAARSEAAAGIATNAADGAAAGAANVLDPVRVAVNANVALNGLQTLDGAALVDNDRVLLVAQANATQNGLWLAHAGAWTRPADFDGVGEAPKGTYVVVNEGSNAGAFTLASEGVTIGTTAQTWRRFRSDNARSVYLRALPSSAPSTVEESFRNWPSLMDALPMQIRAAVREGTYAPDLSLALRDAIETGENFTIPRGTFNFRGDFFEMSTPGQRIVGTGGLLKRLPNIDGLGILVNAPDVELHNLKFDHTAPVPGSAPGFANDTIRIHGGAYGSAKRTKLSYIDINGSRGGGIAILGAEECDGHHIRILNVLDNSLLIAEAGANRNRFGFLYFDGTLRQNNIYITASSGSLDTGEFIYDNEITDFYLMNSADTNGENGYHAVRSKWARGYCYNSTNPGILARDQRGATFDDIEVYAPDYQKQLDLIADPNTNYEGYDGFAVVPLHDGALWDNDVTFTNCTVIGRVTRSAFFRGGSGVRTLNPRGRAYGGLTGQGQEATASAPALNGSDLSGAGLLMAGEELRDIVTLGGSLDGYATGDSWNYDGAANRSRKRCVTRGVEISRCDKTISTFSCVPEGCDISDNYGYGVRSLEYDFADATLAPTAANPRIGLRYVNNKFDPAYFTTVGTRFNPGGGPLYGLKQADDIELLLRPEVRFVSAVLLPQPYFRRAKLYIEGVERQGAGSDSLWGEFDLDAATATVTKISGHADLFGTAGATEFSGWSIYWAFGSLVIQLRGADTGVVNHALKYRIIYA